MRKFIQAVDKIVSGKFGFGVNDFEDFPFFDYYEDGFDPDGYDFQNAVESCAEDFIEQVEVEYGITL
jgi:hypothetical protein